MHLNSVKYLLSVRTKNWKNISFLIILSLHSFLISALSLSTGGMLKMELSFNGIVYIYYEVCLYVNFIFKMASIIFTKFCTLAFLGMRRPLGWVTLFISKKQLNRFWLNFASIQRWVMYSKAISTKKFCQCILGNVTKN